MLIDTHAHLWFPDYYPSEEANQPGYFGELEQVLARSKVAGVEKMIVPGTDIKSSKQAVALTKKYPGVIYAAVGVHPEEVAGNKSSDLSFTSLQTALRSELGGGTVAIGEIGTDMHSEELKAKSNEQKELFRVQCILALEYDLPIIVHTRESFGETWEVLTGLPKMPRGQFHCFSLDSQALEIVIGAGFYVSFCGNITWSKRVAKLVPLVPDERLLLETDSPFMIPRSLDHSPIISQGSKLRDRNEPANTRFLAGKVAELRGQTVEKIEEMTTVNANRLFKL